MGKGNSQPQPPDPYATAAAQSGANKEAIQESAKVSAVDRFAPGGNLTYQRDANGVPTSQTQTLDAPSQQFFNTQEGIRNTLGGDAAQLSQYLPTDKFQMPDNASVDQVQKSLYDRQMGLLKPQLDQAHNQSMVTLGERGIPIGSEVWNNENDRLGRQQTNAEESVAQDAVLAGGNEQNRLLANALTVRAQPFNEMSAFLQGSPALSTPGFQQSPTYNQAAPNISGLVNDNYNQRMTQYNQQQGGLMNGLFGLGSAAMGLFSSDARLKEAIRSVGTTKHGLPLYQFRYKGRPETYEGVMAQDVLGVMPQAVHVATNGFLAVDYGALGVPFRQVA